MFRRPPASGNAVTSATANGSSSSSLSRPQDKSGFFDQDASASEINGSLALAGHSDVSDITILGPVVDGTGRHALLELRRLDDDLALLGIRSKTIYVNSCGPVTIDAVLLPPGQQLSFLGRTSDEPRWTPRDAAEVNEAVDGWIEDLWQGLCDHQPVSGSTVETWIAYFDASRSAHYQLRVEIDLHEWTGFNRFCNEFGAAIADKTRRPELEQPPEWLNVGR